MVLENLLIKQFNLFKLKLTNRTSGIDIVNQKRQENWLIIRFYRSSMCITRDLSLMISSF